MSVCILLFGGIGDVLKIVCVFGLYYVYSFVGFGKMFDDLCCDVCVGGFGGVVGFVVYLCDVGIGFVIDVMYLYVV